MKNKRKKHLTFGDFIAAAYRTWGKAEAAEMVRQAVKVRLVVFHGPEQCLISTGEREPHE
jgi:hypothetical protein